jgi:hypothetical protein
MTLATLLFLSTCFRSDAVELCCPAACVVREKHGVWVANQALGECAKVIGCDRWATWTVGMMCQCR